MDDEEINLDDVNITTEKKEKKRKKGKKKRDMMTNIRLLLELESKLV